MKKVVSHCWVPSTYGTPDGNFGEYNQLQVVDEDGNIWALESYWADPGDEHMTDRWKKVDVPALPNERPRKARRRRAKA